MVFGFEAGGRQGVVGAKEVYVVLRAGIPGCKERRQEGTRAAPEVARVRGERYSLQETALAAGPHPLHSNHEFRLGRDLQAVPTGGFLGKARAPPPFRLLTPPTCASLVDAPAL